MRSFRVEFSGSAFRCLWRRSGCFCRGSGLDYRSNESITLSCDRLNETRVLGIVSQRLSHLAYSGVDAVVAIEINVLSPDPPQDLFPADELAPVLDQEQ